VEVSGSEKYQSFGSSMSEIAAKEKMNRIELDNKRGWWDEIVLENLVTNRS
jgi:hypothetical protein